jgi:Domain of unknown function (DUF4185)
VRAKVAFLSTTLAVVCLAASGGSFVAGANAARAAGNRLDTFEKYSTQAVCSLTGDHGAYTELPPRYTAIDDGLTAGDAGSSFIFDGAVWWLFGNSNPAMDAPWGLENVASRWPATLGPPFHATELDTDAIAFSSLATRPPKPVAPYNDSEMPPNQQCPVLNFVRQSTLPPSPYASPSVFPDPGFDDPFYVSLRTGELPETGISAGDPAKMYVVFGTDNPANCAALVAEGPCADASPPGAAMMCSDTLKGSRTRSLMAVYEGSGARFKGLYDLSVAARRYEPMCPVAPSGDAAKFVNVQMAKSAGYLYLWGTEGGANNERSPVYLARMRLANISTGAGIKYWDDDASPAGFAAVNQKDATPIFSDRPSPCAAQLGVQFNQFLKRWIVLYHCKEAAPIGGHPNGIYMRSAPNPWGPWSAPTTIFVPSADPNTRSGYCFFIYSDQTESAKNPTGSSLCSPSWPNASLADMQKHAGDYYGPYFVANWTTGTSQEGLKPASTTIYYTLDTYDPYGQIIMRSTILGPLPKLKL